MKAVGGVASTRLLTGTERAALWPEIRTWTGIDGDIEGSYPQVFHPEGGADHIGLLAGGQIASFAAVRRVRLIDDRGAREVAFVGSVATDPARRGRGHGSALLEAIAAREAERGTASLMLWSDRWDFYRRLGYEPRGVQCEVTLGAEPPRALVRHAALADLPAIRDLHQAKPWRVERSLGETALLLSARPMQVVVLERNGRAAAYACLGKGVDFGGWWHELGGTDEDLAELLPAATGALGADGATIVVPPYREDLRERLRAGAAQVREGAVALVRTLCGDPPERFFVDGLDSV